MDSKKAEKNATKSNTCGIITPPPENENAEKPTADDSLFWMKTKSLTEKNPSLFFGNSSELVKF